MAWPVSYLEFGIAFYCVNVFIWALTFAGSGFFSLENDVGRGLELRDWGLSAARLVLYPREAWSNNRNSGSRHS